MKSLTKENFWNELAEYHPSAMDAFCKWIDEYKKRVDWNKLFNSHSDWQDANGKNAQAPKFHDLPIEMQVGIFFQFTIEHGGGDSNQLLNDNIVCSMQDFAQAIREWFIELKRFQSREIEAGENYDEQI